MDTPVPSFVTDFEARFLQMEGWVQTANARAERAEAVAAAMKAELASTQAALQDSLQDRSGAREAAVAAQIAAQLAAQQAAERNSQGEEKLQATSSLQGQGGPGLNMVAFAQMQAQAALTTKPRPFAGKGAAAGMPAADWIADAEYVFRTNEQLLGTTDTPSATASRLALAAAALTDEARVWYRGLSERKQEPRSWEGFKKAFKGRFDSVSSSWLIKAELEKLVEQHQGKENMSMEKLSSYCSRFEEMANRLSDEFFPRHAKLDLLAKGLPLRARRTVMDPTVQEDYTQAKSVSEVVATVLKKASTDLYARDGAKGLTAGSSAFPGPSSSGVADMDLGALAMAMKNFGVSRSLAAQYIQEQEGWAPHDTSDSSSSSPPPSQAVALTAMLQNMEPEKAASLLLNAFGTHRNRTAVAQGLRKLVPAELAEARKKAGLCIRCGVVAYVPGGHTARSCKTTVDTTTSAAEGKKKAGMKGF
jgi:hypothetical protein